MYNAYIPGGEPYETIPEDHDPPGFHHLFEKEGSAISGPVSYTHLRAH